MREANRIAVEKMLASDPVLVDIIPAHEAIPELKKNLFLHAGPPIAFADMCEPMKGAVICAALHERLAETPEEAEQLALNGGIEFSPCHTYGAVGPMTGLTTYSMPVWVVEDRNTGQRAFCNISEGQGVGLRFGEYGEKTLKRLDWIEEVAQPIFQKVIREMGGLDLAPMIGQGLAMGDELHMRNLACTALIIKTLTTGIAEHAGEHTADIMRFMSVGNDQFFLNLAMPAMKLAADAADGVPGSSVVTAIARNGVEVGVRISGLPGRWFTAPAPMVDGLYFPGRTEADANPDLGDSAIMEVGGLGGCAMLAAPAIVRFVGASSVDVAWKTTQSMYRVCLAENPKYQIPILDFQGAPTAIDAALVVETGITPTLNTAIASNKAGVGMVGAGMSTIPAKPFEDALIALAEELGI
ncbi:DUF1116 domain-containing protein [Dermabacteraceae bacterium TAE3-ERU27]|nr:DUF1116 domain-containing protein [Dermabacteraceae bacterium TAE3-ERU27]